MRKNFARIVALILVAILALTVLPLGALAAISVDVYEGYADTRRPEGGDLFGVRYLDTETGGKTVTIKTSNYEKYVVHPNGEDYDLKGVIDASKIDLNKKMNLKSSITFDADGYAALIYVPHRHKLSCWISDGTTHWRNCLVCDDTLICRNLCQDGDEDGICNVCGGDVPYHDVTVIDGEGGTITVNRDTASYRTKITADVTLKDGYELKKLHFTKVRTDGSRQEITRYKKNGQFYTNMPTYDLEVSAEFVKK